MMRKVVIGVVLVAIVAGLWASDVLSHLADPEYIREMVKEAGPMGPLVFILVSMGLFAIFMFGPPVWVSGAIWPLPTAILYSCIAALAASLVTYALARAGQNWAQNHVPEKLRSYEERLEARPTLTVLLLRLLLWANPLVDLLVGVSQAPFRSYLVGSLLGLIPVTAIHVIVSKKGVELAGDTPSWVWIVLGAGAVAIFALRRWRQKQEPELEVDPDQEPAPPARSETGH